MGGLNKFSVWEAHYSISRSTLLSLILAIVLSPSSTIFLFLHVFTPSNLITNQGNTSPPPPPPHSAPTTADSSQIKTYRLPEAP